MEVTQDWSVAEWRLDPPFAEAVRHVHSPLCGDHPRVVVGVGNSDESVAALRWAGWEAQLRGTHLHVVNAWDRVVSRPGFSANSGNGRRAG